MTESEKIEPQTFAIPMLGIPPLLIEGRFPLSEKEWSHFMAVLNAMKPGLVSPPTRQADETLHQHPKPVAS